MFTCKIFIRDKEMQLFPSIEDLWLSSLNTLLRNYGKCRPHTGANTHAGTSATLLRREAERKASWVKVTGALRDVTKSSISKRKWNKQVDKSNHVEQFY